MNKRSSFLFVSLTAAALLACSSKDALLSVHDAGADVLLGSGGTGIAGTGGSRANGGATGTATGGTTTRGAGGATTAATGGVIIVGTGGGTGGSGSGRGGTAGGGGRTGSGGASGAGGSSVKDGGAGDAAKDSPVPTDVIECEPGYSVGSSKPAGDGCNTCVCQASGYFACTTTACPAPDASGDACPSGQQWCPGCTPGTGGCGVVCTGTPCLVPDAGCSGDVCGSPDAADASAGDAGSGDAALGCSAVTTQADCQARSDCHAVFTDPGTCGCALSGCCAHFSRCADGGKAQCTPLGTISCDLATPHCESPYVLSYSTYCYEGCVLSTECGP